MTYKLEKQELTLGNEITFEMFLNEIKNKKIKLNFENPQMIQKLQEVFTALSKEEGQIKKVSFPKIIRERLGIKSNSYSVKGLIERGFDEEYAQNFFKENAKHWQNIHKERLDKINSTIYHCGTRSFYSDAKPKCNLCGSELNFALRNDNEITILSCKNENCESHFHRNKKIEAFLPKEMVDEIKLKMKNNFPSTMGFWLSKGYTKDEALKHISETQREKSKKVKNRIIVNKKYIEDKFGQNTDFFRKRSIWCIEYWMAKGYTKEEAKKQVSLYQTQLSLKNNKKTLEERKKGYVRCKEYWMAKGYTEEDAKAEVSKIQATFSLEKCIEKYGKEKGYERWKKRQEKWQDSMNEIGFHQLGCSKISQELFSILEEKYEKEDKDYLFYESKNKEYTIKNKNGGYYRYDFCDLKNRKIIEFNGDIYHGNPSMFKKDDKPHPFKDITSKEIWQIDSDKKNLAIENGFQEMVVWEKDYREDKEKIIQKCLNFLKND